MPELNLGPPPERSYVPVIVISAIALIVVVVLLFVLNPRKTAEITVQKIDLYAPHTVFQQTPGASHVIGAPPSVEDDLYVVASLRIVDKLRFPIFLSSYTYTASMTNPDGSIIEATIVDPVQYPRLEQILPALTPLLTQPQIGQPFRHNDEIDPGAPRVGYVLLLFPQVTQAQWQAKKSASIILNLRDQKSQTVKLP
jgi:hypothetical protein